MKKTILFDFGGTLDTDGIHWSEKFFEAYEYNNISVSKDDFKKAFVYSEKKISRIIKPDFDLQITFRAQIVNQLEFLKNKISFDDDFYSITDKIIEYCYSSVIRNVKTSKEILNLLLPEYSLGLISNYYGNLENVLEELSLKNYFSIIIDSAKVEIRKPDPQIFRCALDSLNLSSNDVLVVGDSYKNDIEPAKSLGCKTIWLRNNGWDNPSETKSADLIINTIKELPKVLNKIKS
jgi:putative hydrolase of the HAD superfamily